MRLIVDDLWTYVDGPADLVRQPTSFFKPGAWFSKAYRKGKWDGRIRLLEHERRSDRWRFPTGLLQSVCDHLDTACQAYNVDDQRDVPATPAPLYELHADEGVLRLDEAPYDYQAAAVDAALLTRRGILKIATNGGKTEIGAAVIKSVGGQWAWITHKKSLLHQTRDRLAMRLQEPVGILGDTQQDLRRVTVCMVQTIDAVFKKSGREHVRDWCRECVGFVGDEMHHADSKQWYRTFLQFPAQWRFGLTATPPRPESGGMFLQAITGGTLVDVSSLELIQRGVSVVPRVWFVPIQEPELPKKAPYPTIYAGGIVHNTLRNQRITEAVSIFYYEHKPTLVLVSRLNHGNNLLKLFRERDLGCGWIHGKVSQAERQRQFECLWGGEYACVVAMVECCGEGVDLPKLRALINATGTKGGGSPTDEETGRLTIQILGRGLRTDAGKTHVDYVDFVDCGHKSLQRATLARIETLESEGYGGFIKYWSDYAVDSPVGA